MITYAHLKKLFFLITSFPLTLAIYANDGKDNTNSEEVAVAELGYDSDNEGFFVLKNVRSHTITTNSSKSSNLKSSPPGVVDDSPSESESFEWTSYPKGEAYDKSLEVLAQLEDHSHSVSNCCSHAKQPATEDRVSLFKELPPESRLTMEDELRIFAQALTISQELLEIPTKQGGDLAFFRLVFLHFKLLHIKHRPGTYEFFQQQHPEEKSKHRNLMAKLIGSDLLLLIQSLTTSLSAEDDWKDPITQFNRYLSMIDSFYRSYKEEHGFLCRGQLRVFALDAQYVELQKLLQRLKYLQRHHPMPPDIEAPPPHPLVLLNNSHVVLSGLLDYLNESTAYILFNKHMPQTVSY